MGGAGRSRLREMSGAGLVVRRRGLLRRGADGVAPRNDVTGIRDGEHETWYPTTKFALPSCIPLTSLRAAHVLRT